MYMYKNGIKIYKYMKSNRNTTSLQKLNSFKTSADTYFRRFSVYSTIFPVIQVMHLFSLNVLQKTPVKNEK